MNTWICTCSAGVLLLANIAWADVSNTPVERTVWGQVTQVEPIINTTTTPPDPDCGGPKPFNANLEDLLQWDLHRDCRSQLSQHMSGYQVTYRWDGRDYSIQMQEQPGPRIPLRLRIR